MVYPASKYFTCPECNKLLMYREIPTTSPDGVSPMQYIKKVECEHCGFEYSIPPAPLPMQEQVLDVGHSVEFIQNAVDLFRSLVIYDICESCGVVYPEPHTSTCLLHRVRTFLEEYHAQ